MHSLNISVPDVLQQFPTNTYILPASDGTRDDGGQFLMQAPGIRGTDIDIMVKYKTATEYKITVK